MITLPAKTASVSTSYAVIPNFTMWKLRVGGGGEGRGGLFMENMRSKCPVQAQVF